MKSYCENAIKQLDFCQGDWGALFVNLRMEFHRLHGNKLITSTSLGAEFFHTLLDCINGKEWSKKEHTGEYEDNFRKLIEIGRKQ